MASAQDLANQIVGVWEWGTESTRKYVDGGDPQNRQIKGVAIFTKGGRFAVMQYPADAKPPSNDADLAALYRTTFFGSGTYKVEGNQVVLKYEVCGNPTWIGQERRPNLKITDGKTMVWVTPQFKDADGKTFVDTYMNTRVE
jgi:hypothetical protein